MTSSTIKTPINPRDPIADYVQAYRKLSADDVETMIKASRWTMRR